MNRYRIKQSLVARRDLAKDQNLPNIWVFQVEVMAVLKQKYQ
jgi:hypothetical protein